MSTVTIELDLHDYEHLVDVSQRQNLSPDALSQSVLVAWLHQLEEVQHTTDALTLEEGRALMRELCGLGTSSKGDVARNHDEYLYQKVGRSDG